MTAPRFLSQPACLILLGALLLLVPAALNGFPFIFPDSIDYLDVSRQIYRLPFYGMFLRFFHWNRFIWPPVIMQCAVASHLLWLMMRLTSGTPAARYFLPFMAGMAAFTSLPFFTGFIIADLFTPVMFLTFFILCFYHRVLSERLLYYVFLLACLSIVMHITNLSLGLGLCLLLLALLKLGRTPWPQLKRPLTLIGTPVLLAITAILLLNVTLYKTWSLSPAGQSFFLANMIEYGPARDYLDEACPTIHYRICKFRPYPETANELLWNDNSVYWQLGSFVGMKEEAARIVHETIRTRPRDVAWMIWDNFRAGLETHTPAAELYAKYQIKFFKNMIQRKFGQGTLDAFNDSAEMHDTIPHETLERIDSIVTTCSFLLLVGIALANLRTRGIAFQLCVATLGFVLADTLLCTAFSGVFDRYQARVTWLMPMVVGLLLVDYLKKRQRA